MKKEISNLRHSRFNIHFTILHKSKKTIYKMSLYEDESFNVTYKGRDNIISWSWDSPTSHKEGEIDISGKYLVDFDFYPNGCNSPYNKKEPFEWDITEYPNKAEAKKIWHNIKPIISKPKWDKEMGYWDIQCACGEWICNPSFGYVTIPKPKYQNLFGPVYDFDKKYFFYRGKPYEKHNWREWHTTEWWDKDTYESIREYQKPLDPESLKGWEIDWPPFEEFYKTNGQEFEGIKKVTKNWQTQVADGFIQCPVCKDMYNMSRVIGYPSFKIRAKLFYLWSYIEGLYFKIRKFFRSIKNGTHRKV